MRDSTGFVEGLFATDFCERHLPKMGGAALSILRTRRGFMRPKRPLGVLTQLRVTTFDGWRAPDGPQRPHCRGQAFVEANTPHEAPIPFSAGRSSGDSRADGYGDGEKPRAIVETMISPAKDGGNKRRVNVREVVNRIMYILSTGCQWRAVPKDLPPRSTLFGYLDLWSLDGTLHPMHHALSVACRKCGDRKASPSAAILIAKT